MSYNPVNQAVFIRAYVGALAGMSVTNRDVGEVSTNNFAFVTECAVASAFAQQFDTQLNMPNLVDLGVLLVQSLSQEYWSGRTPGGDLVLQNPQSYQAPVEALITVILNSVNQFGLDGVPQTDPGTSGSGGAGTLAGNVIGSAGNNFVQSISGIGFGQLTTYAQFNTQFVAANAGPLFLNTSVSDNTRVDETQNNTPVFTGDSVAAVNNYSFPINSCQKLIANVTAVSGDFADMYTATLERAAYQGPTPGIITLLGPTVRTGEARTSGAAAWNADIALLGSPPLSAQGIGCQITGDATRTVGWLVTLRRLVLG